MKDIPYSLGLANFILQRGKEIKLFIDRLNQKKKISPINSFHKKIRRRAMSHNKYRIPSRLRKGVYKYLIDKQANQKIARCRKSLRKSKQLAIEYMKRNSKTKWLLSHIWMVKRMHMIQYFGRKIAYQSKQRNFRSCVRHMHHSCVIHDLSYFVTFIIRNSCFNIKGQYLCIGQQMISYCYSFKDEKQQIIIAHPASKNIIQQYLIKNKSDYQIKDNHCFFLMLGQRSLQKIPIKFKPWGQIQDPNVFQQDKFYQINFSYENKKLIQPPSNIKQQIVEQIVSSQIKLQQKQQNYTIKAWWKQISSQNSKFVTQIRSRYNHKRNKTKKHKKLKQKKSVVQKKKSQQFKQIKLIIQKQQSFIQKKSYKFYVFIKKKQTTNQTLIIVQNQKALDLWKRIIFNGAIPIGRVQLKHIFNQLFVPLYPQDYPKAQGFQSFNQILSQKQYTKYIKKPTKKRPDFFQLNSPFPFTLSLQKISSSINDYQIVFIRTFKGVPKKFAYICKIQDMDLQFIQKQGKMICKHKEPNCLNQSYTIQKETSLVEANKLFNKIKTTRKIIGRVIDGSFNSIDRYGTCIGVILKQYLQQFMLIRNNQSPYYYVSQFIKYAL